jgi:hypothetical protein
MPCRGLQKLLANDVARLQDAGKGDYIPPCCAKMAA